MSLNSEYEIASRFELDPKPTVAHSALQAFQKPFYEVGLAGSVLGEKISPGLSSPDFRKRMAEKIDVINNNLSDPRLGTAQVGLDYVSNFAGSIAPLAPLGFVGGAVGRFALGASGIATRALAPEAFLSLANKPLSQMVAGNYARYFPLIGEATAAKTTKAAVEAYTAYKGFTIPEHIAENYHKENDVLNTREAIHDWAADNYGFLLPTAALAGGYVLFKATKIPGLKRAEQAKAHKVAEEHRTQAAAREAEQSLLRTNEEKAAHREANQTKLEKTLNEAVEENRITEKERDWYLKYLENPNDHEAHFESSKAILDEAQIPYDRVTGKHWFQILDSNDVKNLKNAIADQAATNFTTEETRALSTYIVHNRMDAMRSLMADNPNIVHAIKGYTTFIDSKLGRRAKHFQDFDTILDIHLPKGLGKNELFSQKSIYNHLRKNKIFDHSEVPYSVPEKVAEKLALERKYHRMKSPKFAKYRTATTDKTIETLKQQIKDLELFTPEQELKYIRDTLFENKTLRDDFKSQKAFHRLQELSEIWANAKHLLNRIHMEQEYGRQEAFNTILKRFVDMVDSNAARIANPERVTEYIKRRVESTNPELASYGTDARAIYEEVRNEFKGNETKREGETGVEEKAETKPIFDALKKQVDDFGSEFDKEEFGAIEAKLNQLSANEKALSELIECALGGING